MNHFSHFSEKKRFFDFFNLHSAPKTQEQINSLTSELLDENSKKLMRSRVSYVSIIVVTLVILLTLFLIPILKENDPIKNWYFSFNALLFLTFLSIASCESEQLSELKHNVFLIKTFLGKISDSYQISERNGTILTINTMLSNETLREYLEAVSAQGRELTEAEFEILFDFYTKTDEYLQEQKLARELLIFNDSGEGQS